MTGMTAMTPEQLLAEIARAGTMASGLPTEAGVGPELAENVYPLLGLIVQSVHGRMEEMEVALANFIVGGETMITPDAAQALKGFFAPSMQLCQALSTRKKLPTAIQELMAATAAAADQAMRFIDDCTVELEGEEEEDDEEGEGEGPDLDDLEDDLVPPEPIAEGTEVDAEPVKETA